MPDKIHWFYNDIVGPLPAVTCGQQVPVHSNGQVLALARGTALTKKKIKISSYIRKFRMEQLHSHI